MRQVLGRDDESSPNSIMDGSRILMLDEAHALSTDYRRRVDYSQGSATTQGSQELRADILMSATIDPEKLKIRLQKMGIYDKNTCVFESEERHQDLTNYCLPFRTPIVRDNLEYALRTVVTLHHRYRDGYGRDREGKPDASIKGPIVVFCPWSSRTKILIDMIKNAQQRGFTAGLLTTIVWISRGYSPRCKNISDQWETGF